MGNFDRHRIVEAQFFDARAEIAPSDAAGMALAPGLGERVHRSWWVAKAAVASVERQNGKITLALVNGEAVPVSQSYVPALKIAGWL